MPPAGSDRGAPPRLRAEAAPEGLVDGLVVLEVAEEDVTFRTFSIEVEFP